MAVLDRINQWGVFINILGVDFAARLEKKFHDRCTSFERGDLQGSISGIVSDIQVLRTFRMSCDSGFKFLSRTRTR
jgi:hypothetical protein